MQVAADDRISHVCAHRILYADGISDLRIDGGGSINSIGDRTMRVRVDLAPLERRKSIDIG